jgi:hypothetical protein
MDEMITDVISVSARSYCYEMRVVQAFSWMNFGLRKFQLLVAVTNVREMRL